ncbi:hypothetical protein F4823DRAFT_137129 [Ustulina deusta]|nr:hypothetical protein F4823DRAFT_137129 [Ustulina deusta]
MSGAVWGSRPLPAAIPSLFVSEFFLLLDLRLNALVERCPGNCQDHFAMRLAICRIDEVPDRSSRQNPPPKSLATPNTSS